MVITRRNSTVHVLVSPTPSLLIAISTVKTRFDPDEVDQFRSVRKIVAINGTIKILHRTAARDMMNSILNIYKHGNFTSL